ncbi:hypothetical protein ACH347_39550 [Saccharopolyspora sp. 5N102]|uniref:hypothetical protein n=1 Tax=Saccharopolyspora sp. 5N102 TaxID=3375155 RepID=UPI0037A395DA
MSNVGHVSDAAKTAALAVTMLYWKVTSQAYAAAMVETAGRLAEELHGLGLPLFCGAHGPTRSQQFALRAQRWGGGQHAAKRLRRANLLTCGIGARELDEAVEPSRVAPEVTAWRRRFTGVHYTVDQT